MAKSIRSSGKGASILRQIKVRSQGWTQDEWLAWFQKKSGASWNLEAIEQMLEREAFKATHGVLQTLSVLDGNQIPEDERFTVPIVQHANQTGLRPTDLEGLFLAIASGEIPHALHRGIFGSIGESNGLNTHLYLKTYTIDEMEQVVVSMPGVDHCFPAATQFVFQARVLC